MKSALPVAILVLAAIGLVDATYMTLAHYGVVELHYGSLPTVCRIGPGGCEDVLRSPLGEFMGIPTAILGGVYFLAWLAAASYRLSVGRWPLPTLLMLVLVGGLGFSGYLLHALLFRLSSPCPFCMLAHSLNFAVAIAAIVSFRMDGLIEATVKAVRDQFRIHPPRRWRTHP